MENSYLGGSNYWDAWSVLVYIDVQYSHNSVLILYSRILRGVLPFATCKILKSRN